MINISDEAKKAFLTDGVKKEVFIEFPNNDHATITNSSIIKESLSFTESICSRDEFKFGLAEASTLEFECMNVDNIKGKTIRCRLRADGKHDVLLGTFIVDSCDREADMMKRKVVAYGRSGIEVFKNKPFVFEYNKYEMCQNNNERLTYFIDPAIKIANDLDQVSFSESDVKYTMNINPGMGTSRWFTYITKIEEKTSYRLEVEIRYTTSQSDIYVNQIGNNLSGPNQYIYSVGLPDEIKNKAIALKNDINNVINNIRDGFKAYLSDEELEEAVDGVIEAVSNIDKQAVRYTIRGSRMEWVYIGEDDVFIYPNVIGIKGDVFPFARICIPNSFNARVTKYTGSGSTSTSTIIYKYDYALMENSIEYIYYAKNYSNFTSGIDVYNSDINNIDVNDYISAFAEINGLFGSFWRGDSFSYKKISPLLGRYPSETLYPRTDIYPQDPSGGVSSKSNYLTAVYNDNYIIFDRVSVSFKDLSGLTNQTYLQLIDDINNKPENNMDDSITDYIENYNPEIYTTYSLSYNTIIDNGEFDYETIYNILKKVGQELKKINYMPADIEAQGMPWLEAGDAIGIETKDGGIVTYILRRTLSGIWFLKDNFESR